MERLKSAGYLAWIKAQNSKLAEDDKIITALAAKHEARPDAELRDLYNAGWIKYELARLQISAVERVMEKRGLFRSTGGVSK